MKKSVVISILIILSFSLVLAQTNSSNSDSQSSSNTIDKAYQCLQNQIDSKDESALSLQESIFGVLALGSQSKLLSVIDDKSISDDHWKESSNTLKDTSQVLLAYDRINKNSKDIVDWLKSKEILSTDLIWYLQIDIPNRVPSSCNLKYGNEERTITISADLTLSGNPGNCMSIDANGFWLRVNNNCLNQNFTISCDKDFVTSLLYKRASSSTLFVSPSTHSSSALGTTQETISSKCLAESNSCDYEGTLWGAIALDNAGEDVNSYLPYLLALSETNQKYLPSSFLHKLTLGSDQYSNLVQLQQQSQYWQAPNTPYNRFYDSSLALLSLQGTGATELTNSESYFEGITTPEGCWNNNNIRDTAFLLYSGWPRGVPSSGGGSVLGGSSCTSQGFSCSSLFKCSDLNGEVLDYSCNTGICCSKSPELETCSNLNGIVCSSSQSCSGTEVSSSEGSCCLSSCQEKLQANECQSQGGKCFNSCNSNEEQLSYSCGPTSDVCCIQKTTTSSSSLWVWIILLLILIILVVLGIIYKDKIKIWIYKRRNSKNSNNSGATRKGPPRSPPFYPQGPVPTNRRNTRPIRNLQRTPSKEDKELEETLKKLREMSS